MFSKILRNTADRYDDMKPSIKCVLYLIITIIMASLCIAFAAWAVYSTHKIILISVSAVFLLLTLVFDVIAALTSKN